MNTIPKKPSGRRKVEKPDIRASLIDAAEALIREEGYAAATSRRIAERVGLKHQVIFYYFGSLDDLLVEVYRRIAKLHCDRLVAALASSNPLSAVWDVIREPEMVRLTLEFIALSNHNEKVRAEVAKSTEEIRMLECEGITNYLRTRGIAPRLSPQTVSILSNAAARFLSQESGLGITMGHGELERLIEQSFQAFEATGSTNPGLEPLVEAMADKQPD